MAGIAAAGLSPVTLELLDRFTIAAVDDMNDLGLDRDAAAMLMIESDMPGAAAVDELERPRPRACAAGASNLVRAADAQEADWLRQARRAAHYALERLGDVRMEDVGVPRSKVPDMLRAIERIADAHGVRIGDVRSRRRRQPPPGPRLRARRPGRRGKDRGGQEGPLPGGARPRRDGDRRARHRDGAARLARAAEGRRTPSGVMRAIKAALDPLGHPEPGAGALARRLGHPACGAGPYPPA